MKFAKFLTSFLIFTLLSVSTVSASAAITPTRDQVTTVLSGYDLQGQNNTYQLACEIGQYVSEKYKWNCDIREVSFKNHVPAYVNVLYPTANNSKGYKAVYFWLGPQKKEVQYLDYGAFRYKDLGDLRDATCRIDNVCSWSTVYSFYGNDTTQEIKPVEPTTQPNHDEERMCMNYTNETAIITDNSMNSVQAPVNNTNVRVDNSGNNGTGYQQIAGGNIINEIKIYAQNIYISIVGK